MSNKYTKQHSYSYPLMRAQDYAKLIYQGEFGVEHFGGAGDSTRLLEEMRLAQNEEGTFPLIENVSDKFARVNLKPFAIKNMSAELLSELIEKSSVVVGSSEVYYQKLDEFCDMVKGREILLPLYSTLRFVSDLKSKPIKAMHHSPSYRLNYAPHYRLISRDYATILEILDSIYRLLRHKLSVIVAIDGNSGAGKSYFSQIISNVFGGCNVIHTDDFFLPQSLRNKQRLSEVGGNIDYARLSEVVNKVKFGLPFTYEGYNCHTDSFTEIDFLPKRLTVVEGVYSMHPSVIGQYDNTYIISCIENKQAERILARSGREMLLRFVNEWIPLENLYFYTLPKDVIRVDTSLIS